LVTSLFRLKSLVDPGEVEGNTIWMDHVASQVTLAIHEYGMKRGWSFPEYRLVFPGV